MLGRKSADESEISIINSVCLSAGGNGVKQRMVDGPRHQHMCRLFPSFSETPAIKLLKPELSTLFWPTTP